MTGIERQARRILDSRAKIPNSLGGLEKSAIEICRILDSLNPEMRKPTLVLAAADHGVADSGVSLSPPSVTSQMMNLFIDANGTCALLCRRNGIRLDLVDAGMAQDLETRPRESWITYDVVKTRRSSGDMAKGPTLDIDSVSRTLEAGKAKARALSEEGCNTVILGEMGIGNTTCAGAIASAITGLDAKSCLPRGSADDLAMQRKVSIVSDSVNRLPDRSAMTIMVNLGGLEIIYLAGLCMEASRLGMLILNDGFMTTVAVLLSSRMESLVLSHVLCCHCTGDEAHRNLLGWMGLEPVLEANMHLGEGSGALASFQFLNEGLFLFKNLKSFHDGGISGTLKERRMPFALGTSSYILPADILPNMEYLKDKVDDVELVLFESKEASNIPDGHVITELARYGREYGLTYTVHLPYDVKAGSFDEDQRCHAVQTWLRIIELTKDLPVHGFIVHLEPERYRNEDGTPCLEPSVDVPLWTSQVMKSMKELRAGIEGKVDPTLICVETLSYDLMPYLPLIVSNGFSITLDVGHLWLNGLYSRDYVRTLLQHTRIIHLHGVEGLHDHRSIAVHDRAQLAEFLDTLREFEYKSIVVTLEIFSEQDLETSLSLLHEMEAF